YRLSRPAQLKMPRGESLALLGGNQHPAGPLRLRLRLNQLGRLQDRLVRRLPWPPRPGGQLRGAAPRQQHSGAAGSATRKAPHKRREVVKAKYTALRAELLPRKLHAARQNSTAATLPRG